MSSRSTIAGAVGLALLFVAPASAAGPGDHVRVGQATITPELDLGMEYRTNVYRAAADAVPGGDLLISPGLNVSLDTEQNQFELLGEWDLRKYLFLRADPATRAEQIKALDRFNDFDLGAGLDLLKDRPVGLVLKERATLRNNETDRGVLGTPYMTQVRNQLDGAVRLSPGEALRILPGASWAYDDFRVAGADAFRSRFNARNAYGPTLDARWDFFPRTGVVLRGEGTWNRWSANEVPVLDPFTGVAGVVAVPDSVHVKALGGLSGQFTDHVFLDLLFGYGTALYEPSVSGAVEAGLADLTGARGLIGSAQARYKIVREEEQSLDFGVGYQRDFADSFFTNYVTYDQLQVALSADVSDILPRVRYSIRIESYSGAVVRHDVLNRLEGEVGYRFQEWGKVSLSTFWQQRAILEEALASAEYDEVNVALLTTWTY